MTIQVKNLQIIPTKRREMLNLCWLCRLRGRSLWNTLYSFLAFFFRTFYLISLLLLLLRLFLKRTKKITTRPLQSKQYFLFFYFVFFFFSLLTLLLLLLFNKCKEEERKDDNGTAIRILIKIKKLLIPSVSGSNVLSKNVSTKFQPKK